MYVDEFEISNGARRWEGLEKSGFFYFGLNGRLLLRVELPVKGLLDDFTLKKLDLMTNGDKIS